jgi:hypothetical protein
MNWLFFYLYTAKSGIYQSVTTNTIMLVKEINMQRQLHMLKFKGKVVETVVADSRELCQARFYAICSIICHYILYKQ